MSDNEPDDLARASRATVRVALRAPGEASEERRLREQKLVALLPRLADSELDLLLRTVENMTERKG